eukprot:tig00020510_g9854.t1
MQAAFVAPLPPPASRTARTFDVTATSVRTSATQPRRVAGQKLPAGAARREAVFSSSFAGHRFLVHTPRPQQAALAPSTIVASTDHNPHHKPHTPRVDPSKYKCSTGDRIGQIIAAILFLGCLDAGFSGDWPLTAEQQMTAQHVSTAWAAANALFAVAAARAVRASGPQEVLWYITKGLLAGAPVMLELRKREKTA